MLRAGEQPIDRNAQGRNQSAILNIRLRDEAKRTLVYLAISRKLIDSAPANSLSSVPVMPCGGC
ncbi:MAG: CreA family protein [Propionivibrio sp.]|nr:CreA family protein [Propionivibrio sp.]